MATVYCLMHDGGVAFVSKKKLSNKELMDFIPSDSPKEIGQMLRDRDIYWVRSPFY